MILFLLLFDVFLSACGGDSGSGGTTPPVDYSGYQAQLATLQTTWAGVAVTAPSTLPISGTASFDGVMDLTVQTGSGTLGMAGSVTLISSFTSNSLTGGASNFVDENDVAMSGSLTVSGGVIDRMANTSIAHTFSANIDGTLAGGGDSFFIQGNLQGDFLGSNNLGTSGLVDGLATSSFGTGFVFGTFLAQQ